VRSYETGGALEMTGVTLLASARHP